jgi:hypothetical protein
MLCQAYPSRIAGCAVNADDSGTAFCIPNTKPHVIGFVNTIFHLQLLTEQLPLW